MITKQHLWVLLPHLPFPLWNQHVLEGIANTIGRFVVVDDDFHLTFDKRITRVLFELDISLGLPTEVDILCNERLMIQKLDHLHVSFHCRVCHEIGHLQRSCPVLWSVSSSSSPEGTLNITNRAAIDARELIILGIFPHSQSLSDEVSNSFLDAIDDLVQSRANAPPSVSSPAPSPLSVLMPDPQ